ncbi:MAG: hypothetical protein KAV45_07165 [Calditrichia bacterium]|nr:hypothetical protein [Calditrichia bacterium]
MVKYQEQTVGEKLRRSMLFSGGKSRLLILLSPVIFVFSVVAQEREITLREFTPDAIQCAGFTLNSDREIVIEAIGAGGDKIIKRTKNNFADPQNMFAYAWIIDSRTRDLVWRMTPPNTESDWWGAKYNRKFEGEVSLGKGEYELYYSAFRPIYLATEDGYFSLKRLWDKVWGDDNWWQDNAENWYVTVRNVDKVFEEEAVKKYQKAVKRSAVINITNVRDSQSIKKGFSLKKPVTMRIYAIGEGWEGEMYDFAYIVDANSRERIWVMEEYDTEHAGGALKNRLVQEEIEFDAGNYLVFYQSDDSHSYDDWNSNPPYDPNFWGITISGMGENFDKSIIYKYEERKGEIIVKLDRLGDYEEVFEGFTLDKPMKVRVYAIGEGRNGEMFDYGWIEDARSGRRIWEMHYEDTEHAGGANKNRRFDNVVNLDKGSYLAYYKTDDSHSYKDWNLTRPLDPEGWGMKIYTVIEGDEKYIKKYDPDDDKYILVQIVRVGDDEEREKQFTLNRDTDVRIYALGEGDRDEMYDYAWIEDYNTGRTVWKMRYRDTRKAGGASKNRLFDGTIRLKRGTYVVYYVSDDSHSYGDWNQDPPRDRRSWGVTIYTFNGD